MKKLFVLLAAVLMLLSVSVSAFADERQGDELEIKLFAKLADRYYFADVPDASSDDIRVGESLNIVFSDFSKLANMSQGDIKMGIMLVDDENGMGSVTYHLSDVTITTSDGSNYTISTEGSFTDKLSSGIYEDNTAIIHYFDMSDKTDILANLNQIQQASLSLNYISYDESNGIATAESAPEEEDVPDDVTVPDTGLTMSFIVPAVAAALLIAHKKK